MENPHYCASENSERSKDQTVEFITNTARFMVRRYVSAISVPDWASWANSLPVCLFSQSKLNKHLLGWSAEHLLRSAPLLSSLLPRSTNFCSAMTEKIKQWATFMSPQSAYLISGVQVFMSGGMSDLLDVVVIPTGLSSCINSLI